MGPTKTKNDWLHNLSTTLMNDVTGTTASVGRLMTNDITKLSGDYYFAIQEILTNGKDNSCTSDLRKERLLFWQSGSHLHCSYT